MSIADNLAKGIETVARKHYQIKRAVERANRDLYPRNSYSYRTWRAPPTRTIKEVAFEVMPAAIEKVSSSGRYAFLHRQLFYAVRPLVQARLSNKELTDAYFYTITTEYEERHGPIPGLLYDPRGNFHSPHRDDTVPLGTVAVQAYDVPDDEFQAVLYLEKEGVWPLLSETKFLKRYDLGLLLGKGYATRAAKRLLTKAQARGMPLLVGHDCDRDGYEIARTIEEATRTWAYGLEIIDIGLSVAQVQEMGLETEPANSSKKASWNLEARLDPQAEAFFLRDDLRCELNAMTTEQLIAWLEGRLAEHGLDKKLVPEEERLKERFEAQGQDHLKEEAAAMLAAALAETFKGPLDTLRDRAYALVSEGYAAPKELHEQATEKLNNGYRELWWKTYIDDEAEEHARGWAEHKKVGIVNQLVKELRRRSR